MPDITMCANTACLARKHCERATAVPDKYQSYAMFAEIQCFSPNNAALAKLKKTKKGWMIGKFKITQWEK